MRVFRGVLMLLLLTGSAKAQEAMTKFTEANDFYRASKYKNAVDLYEEIISNGYESAALYYNLGNAYFKTGNIPAAILNYERARRLAPGDEDISYNLRVANLRVVDRIEPLPRLFYIDWWEGFLNLASSSGWAMIGIVLLWSAALSAACVMMFTGPTIQRTFTAAGVIFFLCAGIAYASSYLRIGEEQALDTAIVISTAANVKSAPDRGSTDLFVIHEGLKVGVVDILGDWRKIMLADGKVGWIPMQALEVI